MHINLSTENPVCQSCHSFFPGLSFTMQDFMLWVWKNHGDLHICQGFRPELQQHALFLEGKSKLDWPRSAHNNTENGQPCSEAVDLFVLDPDGKALFPVDRYQALHDEAILAGQPIEWGGSWLTFKDDDHFQNSNWKVPS